MLIDSKSYCFYLDEGGLSAHYDWWPKNKNTCKAGYCSTTKKQEIECKIIFNFVTPFESHIAILVQVHDILIFKVGPYVQL